MADLERRRYRCQRVERPLVIDGSLSDPGWAELPWSGDFLDITGKYAREQDNAKFTVEADDSE